ncbi:MAG: hypothetical protein JWR19_2873 [Pedosphaera sp.]|nr:hypothetical protein [Pedosphaera sp.]
MQKIKVVLMAVVCLALLAGDAVAQDTNAPRTKLEAFEAQTGTVIIMGKDQIGSVPAKAGTVLVGYRESTDTGSGQKEYGITVTIKVSEQIVDTTVIDYDEVESLIGGLERLSQIDWTATPLPSFEAVYTTRSGLRIATYSSRKQPGSIGVSLQSWQIIRSRASLSPEQLAQFRAFINQAKEKLDALLTGK